MLTGKFFLTVIAIAVVVTFIQWFFIGFLFHKYQSRTPSTWRKESSRSYAASTILTLFFAFMFATIFYFWKSKSGGIYFIDGLKFGLVCWLTFSVTTEIGSAIYVNFSRMFVLGRCVSSLFEYIAAGIAAAVLL
jgi:hypothetical protein